MQAYQQTPRYKAYQQAYQQARRDRKAREWLAANSDYLRPASDRRPLSEKLRVMAEQAASPYEAAIAREKLEALGVAVVF